MLNYSIMPLNEEHIEEICDDIVYQVNSGIATMPLFCFTLTPEGDPAIDKAGICCNKYEKYKKVLGEKGIPSGVLIQASIGHGWKLNEPSAFQKYVGLSDGLSPEVCCPYDKNFQAYIRSSAAKIASFAPNHIMLDDDFRLMGARSKHGCACPLHMAEFSRRIGRQVSREELWKTINCDGDEAKRFREVFISTQIDSLVECASEIRKGIDSVNPKIPGSFCLAGECAEGAYEIASIMAGEGNPVVLRVNNANYCATDPRDFVKCLYRAAVELAALSGTPDVVLAETDTCPQNRYSTPAAKLHSHFTFSVLEGMSGAKHWITKLNTYEPKSGRAYRKKLEGNKGFYEELSRITPKLTWLGCNIPVPKKPNYQLTDNDIKLFDGNGWHTRVLDRMGVPTYFSKECGGVCFFDGAKDALFSDSEIIEFLSGKVVLDAVSANRLCKRGFSKYLGVDVKSRGADAKNASGELYYPEGYSVAAYNVHELIPLSDTVKTYSDVYHLRDGKYREIMFPGVTSFKNELGGTAVVYSGNTAFKYSLVDAFGFLNETRKSQLVQILSDLDELQVYYPDDAELFLKAARTEDGKLLCAVLDMSLDAIDNLPLVFKNRVRGVKRLMPDGTYMNVDFDVVDGRVELRLTAYPFDPLILIVDTE